MRRSLLLLLLLALGVAHASLADGAEPWPDLRVDPERVSVSGVSSGGYMASQLHLAHADLISGVGLVAAGPWGCARGNLFRAIGPCVKGGDLDVATDVAKARQLADEGAIATIDHAAAARIYLFHGRQDAAVHRSVVAGAEAFYASLAENADVAVEDAVPAVHGLVTVDQGAACDEFTSPYINACGYDLAGELLRHVSDQPGARAGAAAGTLTEIALTAVLSDEQREQAHLLPTAFLYTPPQCAEAACGLHLVLHGCQQSAEVIQDQLPTLGGFNRWGDALDTLILYPQVGSSAANPLGCWDWWGYTGADYLHRAAPQIEALHRLITGFRG